MTHNEPLVVAFAGHQTGEHAPGWQEWNAAFQAAHHLLLSHGWAVPVLRRNSPGAEVGISLNLIHVEPATSNTADLDAYRHLDGHMARWLLDPLYGRHYPADIVADHTALGRLPASGLDFVQAGDLKAIAAPTDFLGFSYYTRALARAAKDEKEPPPSDPLPPGSEHTEMGWEIYPDGLYHVLCRLHFEYQVPKLYITENGASYSDGPDAEGRVHDTRRVNYLRAHLVAAHRAIQSGVPLAGYFVWSLMDNFEWARGYTQRFGLVWVDFQTQQRIPKDSALWYRDVITRHGLVGLPG